MENSSKTSSSSNNGVQHQPSPSITTRSESSNPCPTTFVQADSSSFKQVVQMLTGSCETVKQVSSNKSASDSQPAKNPIPPRRQQGFKLYERRNSFKNFKISPLLPNLNPNSSPNSSGLSARNKTEILSPSILNFPALALSPVTPLMTDLFIRSPHHHNHQQNGSGRNVILDSRSEEEKAIAVKGFYLHESPTTTPRDSEPQLLPLFPVTSPRISDSSS